MSIFGKLAEFFIYKRSSLIVEAVCCDIFFKSLVLGAFFYVDLQCPLAAAVELAAAEKEFMIRNMTQPFRNSWLHLFRISRWLFQVVLSGFWMGLGRSIF